MASYQVTLTDRSTQEISEAHAFQQEGPMTTFFRNDEARNVVDSWSTRVFSVRTSEVLMIRRMGERARDSGSDHPGSAALRTDAPLVSVGATTNLAGTALRPCARRGAL